MFTERGSRCSHAVHSRSPASLAFSIAHNSSSTRAFAQTRSSPAANSQQYQGILAIQNLPPLPSAPTGECAIVFQESSSNGSVALVYHNASEEVMGINSVTAVTTSKYGTESTSDPEKSNHGPHLLQPGDHGISIQKFNSTLGDDDTLVVEIEAVPETEVDPAVVSLPGTDIVVRDDNGSIFIENTVTNNTGEILAAGCGPISVFFSPDGELIGWLNAPSLRSFEGDVPKRYEYGSNDVTVSDSFMMVFGGRIHS